MKDTEVVLREIDIGATKAGHPQVDKEDAAYLGTIKMGGGVASTDINKINEHIDTACTYCEHEKCTIDHILWYCPFSKNYVGKLRKG